jgi:multifunctional 2-oxoglutarate metabolism enzyme
MQRSLEVPTATSFRNVPAKLLEVNRKVINGFRERSGQGKVSFTHLIGYAIVRAIADAVPTMNNGFVEGSDGKPRIVRNEHVNMGLAVDVDKGDGSRTLVVPVLRDADTLDFAGFLARTRRSSARSSNNKLTLDDFQGANITLTNPGTIGTVQSVPRLMPGQGVIIVVGQHRLPRRVRGCRPFQPVVDRCEQGRHDHEHLRPPHHPGRRVGALPEAHPRAAARRAPLLPGDLPALDMPYEAVKWRPDTNPMNREEAMLHKQMQVAKLIRVHRVRGHLLADLDPLRWKEPHDPSSSTRPRTGSPSGTSTASS